jgi:hypothetical protein
MFAPGVIAGLALVDGALIAQCALALRDYDRQRKKRGRSSSDERHDRAELH